MQLIQTENYKTDILNCLHCNEAFLSNNGSSFCCSGCEIVHNFIRHEKIDLIKNPLKKIDFSYIDSEAYKKLHGVDESSTHIHLYIEGIECAACVWLLEKLPQIEFSIQRSHFDLTRKVLSLKVASGKKFTPALEAISALGYTPIPLATPNDYQSHYRAEQKKLGLRAIIAIVSFGNIMLLSSGIYAGAELWAKSFFEWINFFLCIPAISFSAIPIYRQALRSIKNKIGDVNIPLALTILIAFILSFVSLIFDTGATYFDSISAFIAITLSLRWLYTTLADKYSTKTNLISYRFPSKVKHFLDGNLSLIDPASISPGMTIIYDQGQILATDSTLKSKSCLFDVSTLTGESIPQLFHRDQKVFAGAKVISSSSEVKASSTIDTSEIFKLMASARNKKEKSILLQAIISRYSKILTTTLCIVIPLAFAVLFFTSDFNYALSTTLAIAIIACPCAIAFAVPLLESLMIQRFASRGVIVKDPSSIELISASKTIFFDKTGTLTLGVFKLEKLMGLQPTIEQWQIIYLLEKNSIHPIAKSIISHIKELNIPLPLFFFSSEEIIGQGTFATYKDIQYSIKSLPQNLTSKGFVGCGFYKNNTLVSAFYFTDTLKKSSKQLIKSISKKSYQCGILSGDSNTNVLHLSKSLDINERLVFGELTPNQKMELVSKHYPCIMIGDGANDAEALKAAAVGIAVKGSLELALTSADIYIDNNNLIELENLLSISKLHIWSLKLIVSYSILYNIIGVGAALLGFVTPLNAAILMPINSILILIFCFYITLKTKKEIVL